MSINRVTISGNLTRDPELRTTQSGTSVLQLGIAVNDRRRNPQSGEWEDYPNYINCVTFGNRAESLNKYLSKGSKVMIDGRLRWSQWETQDGQKRSKIEVVIDSLDFGSSRGPNEGSRDANYASRDSGSNASAHLDASAYSAPKIEADDIASDVYEEDDIPF